VVQGLSPERTPKFKIQRKKEVTKNWRESVITVEIKAACYCTNQEKDNRNSELCRRSLWGQEK